MKLTSITFVTCLYINLSQHAPFFDNKQIFPIHHNRIITNTLLRPNSLLAVVVVATVDDATYQIGTIFFRFE